MLETNPTYLNTYLTFVFEQILSDYQQQCDLESSLKMELGEGDESSQKSPLILTNKAAFRRSFNEVAVDLGHFFFQRPFCYSSIQRALGVEKTLRLACWFARFCRVVLELNEYEMFSPEANDEEQGDSLVNIKALLRARPVFRREDLEKNSYVLVKSSDRPEVYMYVHEKIFNLVVYMTLLVVEAWTDRGVSIEEEKPINDIEGLLKDLYVKKKLLFKVIC